MSESSNLFPSGCNCDHTRPDIKPQESLFLDLDSRHILSAAQSDIVHDAISAAIRDVSQLDHEILRLEANLVEIHRKRDEKNKYIFAHKALVAPIRQLPPEIITGIFLLCLPGCPTISPRLAAVCRRWRTIILSCPQVCADISLVVPSKHLDSQIAWAKTCLSHSGEYPLSINLRGNTPNDNMRSLMEVLVARSEQWHTMHLSMPADMVNRLLGAANRLNHLENLSLGLGIETMDISAIFATAPRLCSLRLFSLYGAIPQFPWKQLQFLKIKGIISAKDGLELMMLTSNLQKCNITIDQSSTFNLRSITLPLLRSMSLRITGDARGDSTDFLSAMHFPVIEDLHIDCDLSLTTVIDALLSAISEGTLVKLTLISSGMITAANMVAILRATPTLQELSLKRNSASCISAEFLEHLDGRITYLVPGLQKLEVDCWKEIDIFAVEKMIEGRCHTNHQSTLKQVVLKFRKKDPIGRLRLRQIRDELGSRLDVQFLWQDNTPVGLDST